MALRAEPAVLTGLALCAGIGGLELGLSLALGDAYRCGVYVERDPFAAAVLVARMEDEILDPAPVWDDLTTFDGRPWRGIVDIVSAGFPCQPWSQAGRRKGAADHRWLWTDIANIVRDVGPGWVFLENVPGLAGGGLEHVLGDLAEAGFDAEWDLFSARDAGASHKRERLFILAHARRERDDAHEPQPITGSGEPSRAGRPCPTVADPDVVRRDPGIDGPHPWQSDALRRGQAMGDAHGDGQPVERDGADGRAVAHGHDSQILADANLDRQQAERAGYPGPQPGSHPGLGSLPLFPPHPGDRDNWEAVAGLGVGVEPAIRRVADGVSAQLDYPDSVLRIDPRLAFRVDRLRTLGNGVVPVVAATAFLTLCARFGDTP